MTTNELNNEIRHEYLDFYFDLFGDNDIDSKELFDNCGNIINKAKKEWCIEFALLAIIGTGKVKDNEIAELREEIEEFYNQEYLENENNKKIY